MERRRRRETERKKIEVFPKEKHENFHSPPPPLSLLTVEVLARVVEQHDADLAAVVLVDDAGARVDELFDGEARARGDPGVGARGGGDGESRGDDGAVAGRDDDVLAAA